WTNIPKGKHYQAISLHGVAKLNRSELHAAKERNTRTTDKRYGRAVPGAPPSYTLKSHLHTLVSSSVTYPRASVEFSVEAAAAYEGDDVHETAADVMGEFFERTALP